MVSEQTRTVALCLVAIAVHVMQSDVGADEPANLDAVVKVHSKNRAINLSSPWLKQTPRSVSGSGVIIGDGQLLTNAHVVLNAMEVTLQPFNSSERVPAKVKILAAGIDLALLEFEPTGELLDVEPLTFTSESPAVQSTVQVYGYPTGGDAQSVTEGIISRIEHTSYRYGAVGLRIQIDAAINPGNSGGPAIVDGQVAGIAFSHVRTANDIGYVIPAEEIKKFMDDVADGIYDGKPDFNAIYQHLENPVLRRRLKLSPDVKGVLCHGVREQKDSPLKEGDIITHIADYSVDNRGRCRIRNEVNLSFTRLAVEVADNGHIPVTVIRNGTEQKLTVPVEMRKRLIGYTVGNLPRYFVYGPVVFSEATADYTYAIDAAGVTGDANRRRAMSVVSSLMKQAKSPLIERRHEFRDEDSAEELVVVTRLLTHETARGYRTIPYFLTVKSINNHKVNGFRQLIGLLRDASDEFVEIRFFDSLADVIVLDRQQILTATEAILEDNGIVRQGSRDLMKVWEETE